MGSFEQTLQAIEIERYLSFRGIKSEKRGAELWACCPLHTESSASFHIYSSTLSAEKKKGCWKCFGCGKGGTLWKLEESLGGTSDPRKISSTLAEVAGIRKDSFAAMRQTAEGWNIALLTDAERMRVLLDRKGISEATVRSRLLGFDGRRYTIPIFLGGTILVFKKYEFDGDPKFVSFPTGAGTTLYPEDALKEEGIVVCEGEWDAILLNQSGIPAVTGTGGAATWKEDWGKRFRGKAVAVCYDVDEAGRDGEKRAVEGLKPWAASVRAVALPLSREEYPTGDVSDYLLKGGGTKESLLQLVADAEALHQATPGEPGEADPTSESPPLESLVPRASNEAEAIRLPLWSTSFCAYAGKKVVTQVVVAAKDTAPYLIPKRVRIDCVNDKACKGCPFVDKGCSGEVELALDDERILRLVDSTETEVHRLIRQMAGVPKYCRSARATVLESMNVEDIRVIPRFRDVREEVVLSEDGEGEKHCLRRVFHVGHGILPNKSYEVEGRVYAAPESQHATLLLYKAEAQQGIESSFDGDTKELDHFRAAPREANARLFHLYDDLATNVTKVVEREAMHMAIDLAFHSPLQILWDDQLQKGWVEILLIGDTGQGKSTALERLCIHYGLGERVDTKRCTLAGLLGGMQEMGKRWMISWGRIPLNHGGLVVLEEIQGCDPKVIQSLTNMRSSGIADIAGIEKSRTMAMTRLVWVGNPRKGTRLDSYVYGVRAMSDLMGTPEELRRVDLAIAVASGEVASEIVNAPSRKDVKHEATEARSNLLVRWAWSRKPDQIIFPPETKDAILKTVERHVAKYDPSIPLVEPSDHRLKIARLSAALALRLFASPNGQDVRIEPEHVDIVSKFMESCYDSPAVAYDVYSARAKGARELIDGDAIYPFLQARSSHLATALLEAEVIDLSGIEEWTPCEKGVAKEILSFLKRRKALKQTRRGTYALTPPAIVVLKNAMAENYG